MRALMSAPLMVDGINYTSQISQVMAVHAKAEKKKLLYPISVQWKATHDCKLGNENRGKHSCERDAAAGADDWIKDPDRPLNATLR